MFPSGPNDPSPPGVYVSEDQSEVTSPLSIAEWLLGFHAEARATPGCLEGICNAGQVLHVPSDWWHLVVNLDPAIAITQNFVPAAHLQHALDFLKNKPAQVSGFSPSVKHPYELFVSRMKDIHPAELEQALSRMDKGKKRKWDVVIHGSESDERDTVQRGFSFGFGFGDEDVDDEEEVDNNENL